MPLHLKEDVVLESIDAGGGQVYRFGPGMLDTICLAGWNRASGVKVGDRGRLEYRVAPSHALWWFVKEKQEGEE